MSVSIYTYLYIYIYIQQPYYALLKKIINPHRQCLMPMNMAMPMLAVKTESATTFTREAHFGGTPTWKGGFRSGKHGKTMVFDRENHGFTRKSGLTYLVFLGNMGCSTIFGKSIGKPWSSN